MSHFLTKAQVDQFHEEGYLIVRNLFDAEDLEPVIQEYADLLDRLAEELYESGEISSRYEDLPFGNRLTKIYAESGQVYAQYFDFSLPLGNVEPDTPFWAGPAVFQMLRHEKLLDAVESIIGPEIYSNPVQHVRLKPPEQLTPNVDNALVRKTPVHQDNGVVLPEADETDMLTVWFSFQDTSIKNGCLCVWPGSHRRGFLDHCPTERGLKVPGKLLQGKAISAELKKGDVIFLTKHTLHGSHGNRSDHIRFSFDLRYNPIGQPTGRPVFPGFIARSRQHPDQELRDAKVWEQLWRDTRDRLAQTNMSAGALHRWDINSPVCA